MAYEPVSGVVCELLLLVSAMGYGTRTGSETWKPPIWPVPQSKDKQRSSTFVLSFVKIQLITFRFG